MLLRELLPVLHGEATVFEDIEGAYKAPFFKDLYTGPCKGIPEEFMGRKVDYIIGTREKMVDVKLCRK